MDDSAMEDSTEMLVTRRSRRSTAGNRMSVVMAEMTLDDNLRDLDEDVEFVNVIDEQDVFESDFESTDEEAERQVDEAGDVEVMHEDRRLKKIARSRLEKATAAAHAKHKATFNIDVQVSPPVLRPKTKPRMNREAFESAGFSKTRTSKRMHTVLNTSATVTRLKESEQKRAAQPKKTKAETKTYTQSELIAMALDTEEGNIREHRDYLKNEEEKRKRARVVRTTIEGSKLRWLSRLEDLKTVVPAPEIAPHVAYRSAYGPPGTLFTPTAYTYSSGSLVKTSIASSLSHGSMPTMTFSQYSPYQQSPFPVWPPQPGQQQSYYAASASNTGAPASTVSNQQTISQSLPSSTTTTALPITATPTTAKPSMQTVLGQPSPLVQQPSTSVAPGPEYKLETITKNYVIHELAQQKDTPKPAWVESMQALFGDHVKWDDLKVYVGKNRPLSRPRQMCPVTGRQAHYLDPRTGVPYADSHAYKVLTQLLKHEYIWNPSIGSYLGRGDAAAEAPSDLAGDLSELDQMETN